jgi:hypothetical protein
VVVFRLNPGGSPVADQLVAAGDADASAGRKYHAVPMGIEWMEVTGLRIGTDMAAFSG